MEKECPLQGSCPDSLSEVPLYFTFLYSFAVVVWELLTMVKPYNGVNPFVVAYGVGCNTLTLPIPNGCPEPLAKLMNGKCGIIHSIDPS